MPVDCNLQEKGFSSVYYEHVEAAQDELDKGQEEEEAHEGQ